MQAAIVPEALDGSHLTAGDRSGEGLAGAHWPSIKQYRACAALAFAAPVLGPSQIQTVTQNIKQHLVICHL